MRERLTSMRVNPRHLAGRFIDSHFLKLWGLHRAVFTMEREKRAARPRSRESIHLVTRPEGRSSVPKLHALPEQGCGGALRAGRSLRERAARRIHRCRTILNYHATARLSSIFFLCSLSVAGPGDAKGDFGNDTLGGLRLPPNMKLLHEKNAGTPADCLWNFLHNRTGPSSLPLRGEGRGGHDGTARKKLPPPCRGEGGEGGDDSASQVFTSAACRGSSRTSGGPYGVSRRAR